MKIKDLLYQFDLWAPFALQEKYDNAGLIIGNKENEIKGIIINLDMTEALIDEAIDKNCNVVVSHHPIIFKDIKKINAGNWLSNTIIKAIKNDINLISLHTNLDNIWDGVNMEIAQRLQLKNLEILQPISHHLRKLIFFSPSNSTELLLDKIFEVGGGHVGNYSECSFKINGIGTFRPLENTNPTIGNAGGNRENVNEDRIEIIFPFYRENILVKTLLENHPYEEVAYDIITLNNIQKSLGAGRIGFLENEMLFEDFMNLVKKTFNIPCLKHTQKLKEKIKKIAFCGGSGSFLLNNAISQEADIFLTADFKYHDFFEANNQTTIVDIGHYEIEQYTSKLIFDYLSEKKYNFAIHLSHINTNPIQYF